MPPPIITEANTDIPMATPAAGAVVATPVAVMVEVAGIDRRPRTEDNRGSPMAGHFVFQGAGSSMVRRINADSSTITVPS